MSETTHTKATSTPSSNPLKRKAKSEDGGDGDGDDDDDDQGKQKQTDPLIVKNHGDLNKHEPAPSLPSQILHVSGTPPPPTITGCRSVNHYERLNKIQEGSYGIVYRARNRQTGEIVALKKIKMEGESGGFPITSLREIRTLLEASHPNIVQMKEIVVGKTLTQIYIVMEFLEHDVKTLLSNMRTPFLQSEIKTLMKQLLSAVQLLHQNWILHRDLKTSNLLMNNRGIMKIADFGLARMYGDPIGRMTEMVITLWYRPPELLLGAKVYHSAVDIWSVGCIFAELITSQPLFAGKSEIDQLYQIYKLLGPPSSSLWSNLVNLPNYRYIPSSSHTTRQSIKANLRTKLRYSISENGIDLLAALLTYDPDQRITATMALEHPYFTESPPPAHPDSFGSFPSIAAGENKRAKPSTPPAPQRGAGKTNKQYRMGFDL